MTNSTAYRFVKDMPEKDIIDKFEYYGHQADSIEDAISRHGDKAFDIIRSCSFNDPKFFDHAVIDKVLAQFEVSPYNCFSILHNLSVRLPELTDQLMATYLDNFRRYPKGAIEEFYYVIANDRELVTPELLEAMMDSSSAAPFSVIMSLQMLLARRPELLERSMIEWVRDNIKAGANQAFYFLRDISKSYPQYTPICVQAFFECVVTFHNYAIKKEMLSDIISIAHASHIHTTIAQELKKPYQGGDLAAKELMALIFREKNQRKQVLLLEEMGRTLNWTHVWDFFIFLLENPISKRDLSTINAENFLDGFYRLSYILNPGEIGKQIYERLDMSEAGPMGFESDLDFLNTAGLPELRGKVELVARRLDQGVELGSITEFRERGPRMQQELSALEGLIRTTEDQRKREKIVKRSEKLKQRLADLDNVPETVRKNLRKDVRRDLVHNLTIIVERLLTETRKEAVKKVSIRVLGYESDLWETDECVYPALFVAEKLGGGNSRRYLIKLIEDKIQKREHGWLWTEPRVLRWKEEVEKYQPDVDLSRWRHPFTRTYEYRRDQTQEEKDRRIVSELETVRKRMRDLEIEVHDSDDHKKLVAKLQKAKVKDVTAVQELKSDLERIRRYMVAPVSDFEGTVTLEIETDPFQYLFMGEFGFASCLSMSGAYFWSAVSNAIDIDKCVIWARDPLGNIIARRLIALTPSGLLSYRTYSNRPSLALKRFFNKFISEYAEHCGVTLTSKGSPGPLLSDSWYDDVPVRVN